MGYCHMCMSCLYVGRAAAVVISMVNLVQTKEQKHSEVVGDCLVALLSISHHELVNGGKDFESEGLQVFKGTPWLVSEAHAYTCGNNCLAVITHLPNSMWLATP